MITEVIVICKLLLVNPATSATGERSFSMARRVKKWLRANMKQQSFNNVALLHTHKARTNKIRLLDVAKEFVQRNENRFRNIGKSLSLSLIMLYTTVQIYELYKKKQKNKTYINRYRR